MGFVTLRTLFDDTLKYNFFGAGLYTEMMAGLLFIFLQRVFE